MRSIPFFALSVSILVSLVSVGCGRSDDLQSSVMERSSGTGVLGEPDYKTNDGVSIMEWVKKPGVRKAICDVLRDAKRQGYRSISSEATQMVANTFTLHTAEAEIVAVYAMEFDCPELQ
ncbi:MAG: hypothetical protein RIR26_376 [Pseudomonadota bacterium]